jgi:hypothetical protein
MNDRPSVVAFPRPEIDNMLDSLDKLRERILAGDFESIWIIAWTPHNSLVSVERGKPRERLVKIGAIECFKQDLITCMETNEGPDL